MGTVLRDLQASTLGDSPGIVNLIYHIMLAEMVLQHVNWANHHTYPGSGRATHENLYYS